MRWRGCIGGGLSMAAGCFSPCLEQEDRDDGARRRNAAAYLRNRRNVSRRWHFSSHWRWQVVHQVTGVFWASGRL